MTLNGKKHFILLASLLLFFAKPFILQGQTKSAEISSTAEKLIYDFMELRINLSRTETDAEALILIDDFMNRNYFPQKEIFSEQEQVILENFYITERYNYLQYDINKGKLISENELLELLKRNDAFFEKNKNTELNRWTLVTSANAIGCYMSFKPTQTALKYGTIQKDWYKKACDQKEGYWYGTAHLAQWYFFAPGIFGGSKKKALSLFKDALSYANTNAEKYYSNIFLSQFYFTEGNVTLSEEYLSAADSYLPGGRYVKFIKEINSKGKSTFKYEPEE